MLLDFSTPICQRYVTGLFNTKSTPFFLDSIYYACMRTDSSSKTHQHIINISFIMHDYSDHTQHHNRNKNITIVQHHHFRHELWIYLIHASLYFLPFSMYNPTPLTTPNIYQTSSTSLPWLLLTFTSFLISTLYIPFIPPPYHFINPTLTCDSFLHLRPSILFY